VVVGDVNGDGTPGLAMAYYGSNGGVVRVLLNNGDGTLPAPIISLDGAAVTAVAAGDFNGDGILDLAVPNGKRGQSYQWSMVRPPKPGRAKS
jgi:hypothetical protein